MGAAGIERPHDIRIVVTRWQIVSERSTSDNSGCEQLRHRPKRLVYCDQPFRSHIKGSVVGATGIEPVTPTMSTQQSAAE